MHHYNQVSLVFVCIVIDSDEALGRPLYEGAGPLWAWSLPEELLDYNDY